MRWYNSQLKFIIKIILDLLKQKYKNIILSLLGIGNYVDCFKNNNIEYIIIIDKNNKKRKKNVVLFEKESKMIYEADKILKGSLIDEGKIYKEDNNYFTTHFTFIFKGKYIQKF